MKNMLREPASLMRGITQPSLQLLDCYPRRFPIEKFPQLPPGEKVSSCTLDERLITLSLLSSFFRSGRQLQRGPRADRHHLPGRGRQDRRGPRHPSGKTNTSSFRTQSLIWQKPPECLESHICSLLQIRNELCLGERSCTKRKKCVIS